MPKPNSSFNKRLRERRKVERREEKARRRAERKAAKVDGVAPEMIDPPTKSESEPDASPPPDSP